MRPDTITTKIMKMSSDIIFIWRYSSPAKNPTAKAIIMGVKGNIRISYLGKGLKFNDAHKDETHKNSNKKSNRQ